MLGRSLQSEPGLVGTSSTLFWLRGDNWAAFPQESLVGGERTTAVGQPSLPLPVSGRQIILVRALTHSLSTSPPLYLLGLHSPQQNLIAVATNDGLAGWFSSQEIAACLELSTAQLVVRTPDCLRPSEKAPVELGVDVLVDFLLNLTDGFLLGLLYPELDTAGVQEDTAFRPERSSVPPHTDLLLVAVLLSRAGTPPLLLLPLQLTAPAVMRVIVLLATNCSFQPNILPACDQLT